MIKLIISLLLIYSSSYGWARHIPHSFCSWSKPEGVISIGMIGDSVISYPRCSRYSGCEYDLEGQHPSYKVYEWFAEYIYNLVPR